MNANQLQQILKEKLNFPSFYGNNWNAFWDAISGLVELPEKLIFKNWNDLKNRLPYEANTLEELINKLNKTYPSFSTTLIFESNSELEKEKGE